jgi:hypothetical protein
MLNRAPLDSVLIGTRCGLHVVMGVQVLKRDLALLLTQVVFLIGCSE